MNRALVWRTIQNSTWLIGGLILLGVAFFLWIGIQVHQHIVVEKPVEQGDVPIEPEKVRFSSTLGMMTDVVPPLDLSQTSTSAIHTAEFRGADYIKEQSNRWYLHVMNVTKTEVIKSYLANRTDRDKFTYFRYLEPKQPERYILAYGSFPTVSKALDASKTIQFDLPDSVKVYPERFSELKKFVNDEVAADLQINNLGGSNRLYQVKLRSVPVPVERAAPTGSTGSSTSNNSSSANQPNPVSNPLSSTPTSNLIGSGTSSASTSQASASPGAVKGSQASSAQSTPIQASNTQVTNTASSSLPSGRPNQSGSGLPASNSQTTPNNSGSVGTKPQTVVPKPNANATGSAAATSGTNAEPPRPIADPFN